MDTIVTLRGIATELDSPVGHQFVVDCVRAGEGLLTDREVLEKYEVPPEEWKSIIENTKLIRAIRAESERRVRNGCTRIGRKNIRQSSHHIGRNFDR